MVSFHKRLSSKQDKRIILACDYNITQSTVPVGDDNTKFTISTTDHIISDIKNTSHYLCAIKLNFHLLLPFGMKQTSHILKVAHQFGLQCIADIKLNDIGNTNHITTNILWDMGFDAVIINPIMGLDNLKTLVNSAHEKEKGVITLCHMSAPESTTSYELSVCGQSQTSDKMHKLFLQWAIDSNVDGIIVGATFPDVIRDCATHIQDSGLSCAPYILSPGVGAQGADATATMQSGSDYIIAGRSIIHSENPTHATLSLHEDISRSLSSLS